jgi:ankyrin repeat protein
MKAWLRAATLAVAALASQGQALAGAYEDFFRATEVDNTSGLQELLARGMDPNTLDPQGQHALYLALRSGSGKVVRLLLQHPDTRVDMVNASGETPLMMAALRGDVDTMTLLVARGAQVQREGWAPLHYAASGPSPDAVKWLVQRGAKVDARAPTGSTPLMLAARYGHEDSVFLLLAAGADVQLRDDKGRQAVDLARMDGRDALARRIESHKP